MPDPSSPLRRDRRALLVRLAWFAGLYGASLLAFALVVHALRALVPG